ncbi:MAG TPA: SdpI family protein [Acidimicrobiales bacterium]|jgi:hypothetical protein
MWVGVITLVLGCLAVVEVGRRATAGALPRNRIVGLRTRRTLESDEGWALVHRTAGSTRVGVLVSTGSYH